MPWLSNMMRLVVIVAVPMPAIVIVPVTTFWQSPQLVTAVVSPTSVIV